MQFCSRKVVRLQNITYLCSSYNDIKSHFMSIKDTSPMMGIGVRYLLHRSTFGRLHNKNCKVAQPHNRPTAHLHSSAVEYKHCCVVANLCGYTAAQPHYCIITELCNHTTTQPHIFAAAQPHICKNAQSNDRTFAQMHGCADLYICNRATAHLHNRRTFNIIRYIKATHYE